LHSLPPPNCPAAAGASRVSAALQLHRLLRAVRRGQHQHDGRADVPKNVLLRRAALQHTAPRDGPAPALVHTRGRGRGRLPTCASSLGGTRRTSAPSTESNESPTATAPDASATPPVTTCGRVRPAVGPRARGRVRARARAARGQPCSRPAQLGRARRPRSTPVSGRGPPPPGQEGRGVSN